MDAGYFDFCLIIVAIAMIVLDAILQNKGK